MTLSLEELQVSRPAKLFSSTHAPVDSAGQGNGERALCSNCGKRKAEYKVKTVVLCGGCKIAAERLGWKAQALKGRK